MTEKITRVFDCIEYQNSNYPQKEALVYKEKGKWISYSSEEFIKIYPNPSIDNRIKIKTNPACSILEVFSLDGKKIIQQTIENKSDIDLILEKGVYQICLKDNNMNVIYLEKVIIQF